MGINSFSPANPMGAAIAKQAVMIGPVALGPGLSVPISATDLWVTQATFYGYSSATQNGPPVNNASNIAVGPTGGVIDVVVPGGSVTYAPAPGTRFNLKDIVAAGPGTTAVMVSYLQ